MSTLGDLWDMERRVMEFYDSLMAEFNAGGGQDITLRGLAYQTVMSYRTIQVELVNSMARNRHGSVAALATFPDDHELTDHEASVLRLMKGMFQLHRNELADAVGISEKKSPKQAARFQNILDTVEIDPRGGRRA